MGLPKLPPCPYPQTLLFLTTPVFPSCTQESTLHPPFSFWLLEHLSHQDINYKYFTASLTLPIPLIVPRNTEISLTHFHYTQKNPKTKGTHPSLYPVCPPSSSFLFPWPSNFMRHQGYLSPMASPAIPSSTHCDPASTLMTTQKTAFIKVANNLFSIRPLQFKFYWSSLQHLMLLNTLSFF